MNTVLITGCSSGYGLETAHFFHAQGWNVIATMRTPREGILKERPAPLENAPFPTPWARKRCSVAQRFRQY